MASKFKCGDPARIVGLHQYMGDFFIGMECRIIGVGLFRGYDGPEIYPYLIRVAGWGDMVAGDTELEPILKTPVGSWKEVEVLTGWNPLKEKAKENETQPCTIG